MTWILSVLICGCVLLPLPCSAATIVQRKGAATLEVYFDADKPALTLADTITVTLTIEGSSDLQIKFPRDGPASSPWILVESAKVLRDTLGPGRVRWRQLSRYAPREPGRAVSFVFPEVQIRDGDNAPRTIHWEPVAFVITTSITQPDAKSLRDITGIEKVPEPNTPAAPSWLGWLILLSLPLPVVIVFVWRRFLRRQKSRSPLQRALYGWQRLLSMKLPEQGRGERFMTLLTLLVRDYLQRDLHLPARRRTTQEFLQELSEALSLTNEDKIFLSELLQRGDVVKYARVDIARDECYGWAENLRQFLKRRENVLVKKSG